MKKRILILLILSFFEKINFVGIDYKDTGRVLKVEDPMREKILNYEELRFCLLRAVFLNNRPEAAASREGELLKEDLCSVFDREKLSPLFCEPLGFYGEWLGIFDGFLFGQSEMLTSDSVCGTREDREKNLCNNSLLLFFIKLYLMKNELLYITLEDLISLKGFGFFSLDNIIFRIDRLSENSRQKIFGFKDGIEKEGLAWLKKKPNKGPLRYIWELHSGFDGKTRRLGWLYKVSSLPKNILSVANLFAWDSVVRTESIDLFRNYDFSLSSNSISSEVSDDFERDLINQLLEHEEHHENFIEKIVVEYGERLIKKIINQEKISRDFSKFGFLLLISKLIIKKGDNLYWLDLIIGKHYSKNSFKRDIDTFNFLKEFLCNHYSDQWILSGEYKNPVQVEGELYQKYKESNEQDDQDILQIYWCIRFILDEGFYDKVQEDSKKKTSEDLKNLLDGVYRN